MEIVIPRVERRLSETENKLTENTDNLKVTNSLSQIKCQMTFATTQN